MFKLQIERIQIEDKIKYAALLVFLITAYFSVGFYHPDEHFQILEFAQYKLGNIDASILPWEFHEKMRSSLQPWIAYSIIKTVRFFHIINPFVITGILRSLSALFLWFVISKLDSLIIKNYFPHHKWSNLFYLSSFFIWFVPYLSVRFSSENYAQGVLLLALIFFMKNKNGLRNLLGMGIFLGLSVLFRYQMGIVALCIFSWIIMIEKIPFSKLIYSFLAFILVLIIGVFLDYLFYNEVVFTAFNYLKQNLIEGKATNFGTASWWFYLVKFLIVAIPPVSIVLLTFFFVGLIKLRNDFLTWVILPFIIVHFLIGHKEMRFFFPISYLFIFISIYGLMVYFNHRKIKKVHRVLYKLTVWINAALLLFIMFRPADEMVANYRYLYNNINLGKRTILTLNTDTYNLIAGLTSTFYTPDSILTHHFASKEALVNYVAGEGIDSCFFVYGKFEFEGRIKNYKVEKVFSVYPPWIKKIKWIDWQKALDTHSVFLLTRKTE